MKSRTFLSLFSGCGGLDLGFLQAGYECSGAVDIDKEALEINHANLDSPILNVDLSSFASHKLLPSGIDVVIAGPPCQGFSTVGKRVLTDPRNHLLVSAARIGVKLKPRVIVIENVAGVTAGEHKTYIARAEEIMQSAGYTTTRLKLLASEFGLAQARTRIILLGWRGSGNYKAQKPGARVVTIERALKNAHQGFDHDPHWIEKNTPEYHIAKKIKQGQKLSNVRGGPNSVHTWNIPEAFPAVTLEEQRVLEGLLLMRRRNRIRSFGDADPVRLELVREELGISALRRISALERKGYVKIVGSTCDLRNTFNGKFRRLDWKKLSPTVDTRFGDPKYFLHPDDHRGLSAREAARIQGFPDWFKFDGATRTKFRVIGNAVPPPMSEAVATQILKSFFR